MSESSFTGVETGRCAGKTQGFQCHALTKRPNEIIDFYTACPACSYAVQNEGSLAHCEKRFGSLFMSAKVFFKMASCVEREY